MDDLFRFMTVRAPQSADPGAAVPLTGAKGTTAFQDLLRPLRGTRDAFAQMVELARKYQASEDFAGSPSSLKLKAKVDALIRRLTDLAARTGAVVLDDVAKAIADSFGAKASDVAAGADFASDLDRVHDSLVALFLSPANGRPSTVSTPTPPLSRPVPLEPLAAHARALHVVGRAAKADATLAAPGGISDALQRTLVLPPSIFPLFPATAVRPVGVADLRIVRQHLNRYEAGEVGTVENMMAGESRSATRKHTLSVEQTDLLDQEKTTETSRDLKSTERFELNSEVESTLKEDMSVSAGLSISAKFGPMFALDTNANVSSSTSRQTSTKTASNLAKEVTLRAASKVTERIRTQEISKTVETFLDQEDHVLDNGSSTANLRGVYQWLNKVYTAQVFNYGKRLLFDITVPEPAAFLLSTLDAGAGGERPVPPIPFTVDGTEGGPALRPVDLSPDAEHGRPGATKPDPAFYQVFAARYGTQGLEEPPPKQLIVSTSFEPADTSASAFTNLLADTLSTLKIPDGYVADEVRVNGSCTRKHANVDCPIVLPQFGQISVFVGPTAFHLTQTGSGDDHLSLSAVNRLPAVGMNDERDRLPAAISTFNVQQLAMTVEVICVRTDEALEAWQLRAYGTILQAFNQQLSDFKDRLAAFNANRRVAAGGPVPLGGSADKNRALERQELKKSALEVLAGVNLVDQKVADQRLGAVVSTPPAGQARNFPRLDLAKARQQGAYASFFEQAFEWEELTYFFFPYYWGRLSTWYDKAVMTHDDPLFLQFLQAGEARVVVPVRPGFEDDVYYYLTTGQLWGGGSLPGVTDADYLPITEEIKALTGAPGNEKPEGDPWEVVLPTNLVKLRDDGKLPAFKQARPGDWTSWVEDPNGFV